MIAPFEPTTTTKNKVIDVEKGGEDDDLQDATTAATAANDDDVVVAGPPRRPPATKTSSRRISFLHFVMVVLAIVLVLGLVLGLTLRNQHNKNNDSSSIQTGASTTTTIPEETAADAPRSPSEHRQWDHAADSSHYSFSSSTAGVTTMGSSGADDEASTPAVLKRRQWSHAGSSHFNFPHRRRF